MPRADRRPAPNTAERPVARRGSIEALDREIVSLAARINAATYDLLVLIRRFDERAGWLGWGFERCADWLHWRCDISLSAAREKVRVAHALKTLPSLGAAFANGALSYSKVRALTRVAGPANENALLRFARGTTAARADALVELARAYLSGKGSGAAGRSADHYQITVHVDEAALRGGVEPLGLPRSTLPIESVRRLGCDGTVVAIVEDATGEPLSVGRRTRLVPAAIRRALWARDRGCRFPGCGRTRFVDAHHVEHWSVGGQTCLDNLILLCGTHHRFVHEGRFRIEKNYRDRWFFRRPDGRAVPACGYRPDDMTDGGAGAEREYVAAHPSAEGSMVRESPAPLVDSMSEATRGLILRAPKMSQSIREENQYACEKDRNEKQSHRDQGEIH